MSLSDYLFRPIPGPHYLSKRVYRTRGGKFCGNFLFRINPEHEARVVAAARERLRIKAANREQFS